MTRRGAKNKAAEMRGPINGLIVEYMRKHNVENVREFADIVGIGRTTIYDLVRGRSTINGAWMKPSLDTLVRLATVLERPTHELLYLIDPEAPGADVPLSAEVTQVPIAIAGHAGAGPDQNFKLDGYTYVEREFATGRELLAFRIVGDSMAGGTHPIYKDDLVIVDRRLEGEINSAVVARLIGDGYVCKRLRPGNILDSSNPEFLDPQQAIITGDRIDKIIGKVVRIIHTSL
ncbi:LexA family protein [Deinococcus humi]|uniref:Repressor LexA n=1 Tax=Deinococcus humi TaxID=662880 RepID=A0A7W8JUH9_9DEIO|nr:S24 family peptidase [Deinococcus humi]MBB5363053.1 repressor LexA [Deinococcus humi]